MKISLHNEEPTRKLIGYIGDNNIGLFLQEDGFSDVCYITPEGMVQTLNMTMKSIGSNPRRTPIYEGDKITIEF